MRAVVISSFGGPDVLELREMNDPVPLGEQVRVRVHSAGLNRADLLQRVGRYPAPPGSPRDIPGLEFAGVVDLLGPDARLLQVGDRVYGIAGGGSQADYVVAHERAVARIPSSVSMIDAGGVPEVFITAHDALFLQAGLTAGETVLVHAVGSGVGLAALQLAHAAGARTIGTSRSRDKLHKALEFGLDVPLTNAEFMETASDIHADVLIDVLGGAAFAQNVAALAPHGRLILLSTLSGDAAVVSISLLMQRAARIVGTLMRPRPVEARIAVTQSFARQVTPLFEAGKIRPVTDRVFEMDRVSEAHTYLASNASFGKVVLKVL